MDEQAMRKRVDRARRVQEWNERTAAATRVPVPKRTAFVVYHRTSLEVAELILASGFKDATGTYMTGEEHTGVFVSDVPLDVSEGAKSNDALLRAHGLSEKAIAEHEWVQEDSPYREWCVPAALLNECAIEVVDESTEEL